MRSRAAPERVTSSPIHCTRPSQARSADSSVVTGLPSRSHGSSASIMTPTLGQIASAGAQRRAQRWQMDAHVALGELRRLALLHQALDATVRDIVELDEAQRHAAVRAAEHLRVDVERRCAVAAG